VLVRCWCKSTSNVWTTAAGHGAVKLTDVDDLNSPTSSGCAKRPQLEFASITGRRDQRRQLEFADIAGGTTNDSNLNSPILPMAAETTAT
jgi:hypothetical protein